MNETFKNELWRKSVHLSGIFFLPVLFWNREIFTALFFVYLALYLTVEWASRRGEAIPLLTWLTQKCKRPEESGRPSRGAVFIALSAILTPYLYGIDASAVGLAQVFVADVAASVAGMRFGDKRLPYSKGKSWVGTVSFFVIATCISAYFIPWPQAILLGLAGALIESLPIPEGDNLTVPLGVGACAYFLMR